MAGMALDTQHLRDHLKLLTGFTEHFETHTTTNVGQVSREMYERALWTNVFSRAFNDDVRAAWLIPLRFHLETGEVTWAGTVLCLCGHLGRPPLLITLPRFSTSPTRKNPPAS